MALAECGTHAIIDAELGAYTTGELSLAPALTRSLTAGMLVLGDRGLVSFDLWRAMAQTGADLLWRTRTNAVLPVVQTLPDGSYRSQIVAARDHRHGRDPITVRVVEYHLQDPGRPRRPAPYRLVTTILDPDAAPAVELAALYAQRWELETALDELKTHQRGPGLVLRSKTPKEWSRRCGACSWSTTPSGSSCTRPPWTARSTPTGSRSSAPFAWSAAKSCARRAFPPRRLALAITATTTELLRYLVPKRRLRANPRVVKRKMSNFGVKRAAHRCWPQPTRPAHRAIVLVPASRPIGTRRLPPTPDSPPTPPIS
jgi:Transposase DDE domain